MADYDAICIGHGLFIYLNIHPLVMCLVIRVPVGQSGNSSGAISYQRF